jgi:hypothetical protein
LQQRDASLKGAAMLATGRLDKTAIEAIKISTDTRSSKLSAKYLRWKVWLDTRLLA